ncbi:MAG: cation:proton antiporter [Rhodospirillales bacterium]|nr:cation:proton antiporter [Rhodospirillales bacterium]
MPVQTELTSIAIIVLVALACGLICSRFKLPSIIGYILAGIALGPSGFSLVDDRGDIGVVAELGVLLLLYSIGMQLSLRGFRAIWKTAVGTALLQIAGAIGVMLLLGLTMDWPIGVCIVLGFVVALSSTVVAIRILEDLNLLRTQVGQMTVSILIAQDLAVIPMILVIQMLAGGPVEIIDFARILAAAGFLGFLCWYLSRRARVHLPLSGLLAQETDLRPLYGVGACFGFAVLAAYLHLTPAYGAFLAGLLVGNSNIRNVMIRSVRPIQNLLMMAFFVSIGLLVDLTFIAGNIGTVLVIVLTVTVLKTLFNIGVLRLLGEPWPHAFISGLLIAQIGEFSFLIGETGFDVGLIDVQEKNLIVAVTVITLLISPIWLATARRIVRIAFTNARTLGEILARFRDGGLTAIILAARKAAPSPRAASLYFGRAGNRRHRGVIAEEDTEENPGAGGPAKP